MSVAEILPYVGVISLVIATGVLVYQFGKWRQKNDSEREEIKKKLDEICGKLDRTPDDLFSKFIDMYKIWEKMNEDPNIVNPKRKPRHD